MAEVGNVTVRADAVITDEHYRVAMGAVMAANECMDLLVAENVKLREDLEFERSENGWAREFLNRMGQKCGTKDCPSLVAYVTKLKADNAKLRELVRDMWEGYNDPRCEECHLKDTPKCADCPICAREAAVIDHMRELGVVL